MLPRLKLDPVTWVYLGLVTLGGIAYTSFELTPSSYGEVLTQIGAPEFGPVFGYSRSIRSDEYALTTPFFQATVRNDFRRVNDTSFYHEDLRSQSIPIGLPIKDWSLVFKPQLWAFFIASPAMAYSAFWALTMCACLAGYQLLLRQLGVDALIAILVAVMIFFSGFVQFWWTTFGPLVAGFPWILLILFSSLRWWHKALLFSWVLPIYSLADLYPALIVNLAFAAVVVVLALRPSLLRSPRELAAVAVGGVTMLAVLSTYYADVIPIMRNTVTPGRRVSEPGGAAITAVVSQLYPFISFNLTNYINFRGINICEVGTLGTFLPVLTLCLARYRDVWNHHFVRRALIVLFAALTLVTLWQIAPAPRWIGRILLWNLGPATRLLMASGLLLTIASLLIWRHKLIAVHPARIMIFVLIGPVASWLFKLAVWHTGLEESIPDLLILGLILFGAMIACYAPVTARPYVLLAAITLANVYGFGRFNPLQPAEPIFETPETDFVRQLRAAQDASPEHILLDRRFFGATPNGMGFRSVSHALMTPKLAVFQEYFPTMDADRFNFVFNRFSHIQLTDDPLPNVPVPIVTNVPIEAFEPVRNLRQVTLENASRKDCSQRREGAVDRVSVKDGRIIVEGWAPWRGEDKTQELRVLSARALRAEPLLTIKRPDIAEARKDYGYARAGFRLTLSSMDGRPLLPEEIVLVAHGTPLAGCGCN